jgi:dynein heavy chain
VVSAGLQGERLPGKSLFFVRVNPKGVSEKTLESDLAVGEIQGSALDTFKALLAEVFVPLLQEQGSWGKMPPQHTKDFLTGADTGTLCWI